MGAVEDFTEGERIKRLEDARERALNIGADPSEVARQADEELALAYQSWMNACLSMFNQAARQRSEMNAITNITFALSRQLELIRQQNEEIIRLLKSVAGEEEPEAGVTVTFTWAGDALSASMRFEDTGETRDYPATFENTGGMDRDAFEEKAARQIERVIRKPVRWQSAN